MTLDVVVNASPLILLTGIGRIELLNRLFKEVYVPSAVLQEIRAMDEVAMNEALSRLSFECIEVSNRIAVDGLLGKLHLGEVEAIIGAIEKGVARVVMDDIAARNKARQMGLEVTGTIGILLKALEHGLLDDILPEIEKLKQAGMYLSDELLNRIQKSY
jgi:predicted nucleic acid-binding protein